MARRPVTGGDLDAPATKRDMRELREELRHELEPRPGTRDADWTASARGEHVAFRMLMTGVIPIDTGTMSGTVGPP